MPSRIGPFWDVTSWAPPGAPRDGSNEFDWSGPIQQAIEHVLALPIAGADSGTVYFPPGRYRITKPLIVATKRADNKGFAFASVSLRGDARGYGHNSFHGAAIVCDFRDPDDPGPNKRPLPDSAYPPALILQSVRAVTLENLSFIGPNNWLGSRNIGDMSTFDNDANFLARPTLRDKRYSPQAAIAIDPFHAKVADADRYPTLKDWYVGEGSGGGSSIVRIRECEFFNHVVGVSISSNGSTLNAEDIVLENPLFHSVKVAIAVCQPQSRGLKVDNLRVVGAGTVIDCRGYGQGLGDPPQIVGGLVAGAKYLFRTFSFLGECAVSGLFCENLYSIGMLGGGASFDGHTFSGCSFKFGRSPEGKPAIPFRLFNEAMAHFTGCSFTVEWVGLEPMWIYHNGLAGQTIFDACRFHCNLADVSSRVWPNGTRESVKFRDCTMTTSPRNSALTDRWVVDHYSNALDHPVLPGTTIQSLADASALRWVPGGWYPWGLVGVAITFNGDGTGSFLLPEAHAGRVAPGDMIHTRTVYSVIPAVEGNPTLRTHTVVGRVAHIAGNRVNLEFVPGFITAGTTTHDIYPMWLPRVHLPTRGTIDASSAPAVIEGVTQVASWKAGEHIRDREGRLSVGTYITEVDLAAKRIVLSRPASGSGVLALTLIDADLKAFSTTDV